MENLNMILMIMIGLSMILFVSGNVVNFDMAIMGEKLALSTVLPTPRDFDIDFKYIKFLVDREINSVKINVINAAHKSNCGKHIIGDDVYNDAVTIATTEVLHKLSDKQKDILGFYVNSDKIDEFVIGLVTDDLFPYVDSMNNKTIKGYQ